MCCECQHKVRPLSLGNNYGNGQFKCRLPSQMVGREEADREGSGRKSMCARGADGLGGVGVCFCLCGMWSRRSKGLGRREHGFQHPLCHGLQTLDSPGLSFSVKQGKENPPRLHAVAVVNSFSHAPSHAGGRVGFGPRGVGSQSTENSCRYRLTLCLSSQA